MSPELQISLKTGKPDIRKRPVAILDVLGFRDTINSKPLEEVYRRYLTFLALAGASGGIRSQPQLVIASDTVFAYFPPTVQPDNALRYLIRYTSVALSNSLVLPEGWVWPLRGSISFGPLIVDKAGFVTSDDRMKRVPEFPVVLGKPFVQAIAWERHQKWIGASIDPESRAALDEAHPGLLLGLCQKGYLIDWDVPTRNGLVQALAVNYCFKGRAERLLGRLESAERRERQAGRLGVVAKYLAAIRFLTFALKNGAYNPHGPVDTSDTGFASNDNT